MIQRGPWHQFGDKSQKQVIEQLEHRVGVGVIISPRDLALDNAKKYCVEEYSRFNVDVLYDHQLYVPDFSNAKLKTYPAHDLRASISNLSKVTSDERDSLSQALEEINRDLGSTAVLAPAVVYEANSSDILHLNEDLFSAAKKAGDALGKPTFATVVLGRSVTVSPAEISSALTHATALNAEGWYFAYEFNEPRIPAKVGDVYACGQACLTLATKGKPVIHAFAGPMALLSLGFGATGTAVGHSQTLWQFQRARFAPPKKGGGGGDAPPRFFSTSLWGTIITPDELATLPSPLLQEVLTTTAFSSILTPTTVRTANWSRWDAGKHLVNAICAKVHSIADSNPTAIGAANAAVQILDDAEGLHSRIATAGITLKDESLNLYQPGWLAAMRQLISEKRDDYDYLELFS